MEAVVAALLVASALSRAVHPGESHSPPRVAYVVCEAGRNAAPAAARTRGITALRKIIKHLRI